MSGRFDGIDLNSDVVPVERHEVHGTNTSGGSTAETLTDRRIGEGQVADGPGSADRGNSAEVEKGELGSGNDAEVVDRLTAGEIVASDGGVDLGVEGNVLEDPVCSDKNEPTGNNLSGFSAEGFVDRSRDSATTEVAHWSEEGEYHDGGLTEKKDVAADTQDSQHIRKRSDEQAGLKLESQRKVRGSEKVGHFHLGDLVWGKVRSHPWWPGQIFDPSDSSEKAKRYSRRDGFLIAYFGDNTFAWNDASRLKPFRTYFSQMAKQSCSDAFCNALGCALEEVSRRVEFGLSCSCLSPVVFDKIKTQVIVNAGIQDESSKRNGGDEYSNVASFKPLNLIRYMKDLAQSPSRGTDGLEFITARAQLLAFNRWKGCYWLPEFKILGGLSEDGVDFPVTTEIMYSEDAIADTVSVPASNEPIISSQKRKGSPGGGVVPRKKERRISDLMSYCGSDLSTGKSELEDKAGRRLASASSVKKRKTVNTVSDNEEMKTREFSLSPVRKPQFSRVGESIRRVASQLAVSTPILKDGLRKSVGENGRDRRSSRIISEKSQRTVITAEHSSPDEMLSQLCVAARDPMREHGFFVSVVDFFSNFRNSSCLENSTTQLPKKFTGKVSGKQTGKKPSNSEMKEVSGCEGMEDSYWTDRIVQGSPEELELFEPEIPTEGVNSAVGPDVVINSGPTLDSKQELPVVNCEVEAETCHMDEIPEEEYTPTALVLNFTDLDSVPSESSLNKIFSGYGPLSELDTEVLGKSKRAKVVFKRRSDAENAFSSTGKFSIFGPSLVSYRLKYLPPMPCKTPSSATKRRRKTVASVDGGDV